MAEYIEKAKVVDWFRSYGHMDEPIPFETLVSDLRDMIPSADVEPVIHAKWIRYHEADIGWDEYGYRCSECKIELEDKDFWGMFTKRCPNCGARMDGE